MGRACGHCGQIHDGYLVACPVTGARLASATYTAVNEDEALVGNVIAERYHLKEIIGQGSTGTVFGAQHMHFARPCVMKVLRPRYVPLETVRRVFNSDARAAWSVTHPSLAEIFDIGTLPDGAPFFVTERFEGETLATRLRRDRFSIAAAVDLMMQVLSVIDAIHARNLVLRDLHPQNVFLAHRRGCRPVVKILDFGLGRLVPLERVEREWDALRAVVGTGDTGMVSIPFYLSPERARGAPSVGPESDLFSAAAIFYEVLAGQRPFDGGTYQNLLLEITRAAPRALGTLRPDAPEELAALIMRALSPDAHCRPASAREMQDELRGAFEGLRRGSTPLGAVPLTRSGARPRPRATPIPNLARSVDGLEEDETRTDRKLLAVAEPARPEAQATVRGEAPPRSDVDTEVDVDVDVPDDLAIDVELDDPTTSRGVDFATALLSMNIRKPRQPGGDDEADTMDLAPEIRARIEEMTKAAALPPPRSSTPLPPRSSFPEDNRAPNTRRLKR